jgi:hypothetical protein
MVLLTPFVPEVRPTYHSPIIAENGYDYYVYNSLGQGRERAAY